MDVNDPDTVAEVRRLFERYEQALVDKDVEVLDDTFWRDPRTIRYAVRENCYGFEAIHAARVNMPVVAGGTKEKRIRLEFLAVGTDVVVVNLEYKPRGSEGVGRQSQTWFRFPAEGWKVIAAHVSVMV